MTSAKNELSSALCDVRKAYRLLHGYHRRVLDVASTIASQFGKMSWLATEFGCSPMTRRRNPFDQGYWMWDATPMVQTHFLFTESGSDSRGDYLLDITVVGDSEFYDYEYSGEPNPAEFEKTPEAAASRIDLLLVASRTKQRNRSWLKVWKGNERPDHEMIEDWNNGSYRAYCETIAMEELVDTEAVTQLSQRFRKTAFSKLDLTT